MTAPGTPATQSPPFCKDPEAHRGDWIPSEEGPPICTLCGLPAEADLEQPRRNGGQGLAKAPTEKAARSESEGAGGRRPLELDPDAPPEPPDYLVDGRIERGTVTALAGDTGTAKSFTAQSLVIATVERRDAWLGRRLKPGEGRVLVIDEENPRRLVGARLTALGLTTANKGRLRYFHQQGVRLGDGESNEWLRAELEAHPADLLVIDTATAATAVDLLDNTEVTRLYADVLRPLAAQFGLAIVLLLHERKPGPGGSAGPRSMRSLGARSWIGQADSQLILSRSGEGTEETQADGTIALQTRFTLDVGKLRDGGGANREALTVTSELSAERALLSAQVASAELSAPTSSAAEQVAELLAETPGMTREELAVATGKVERTVRRALGELGATDSGTSPKRWFLPEGEQGELDE